MQCAQNHIRTSLSSAALVSWFVQLVCGAGLYSWFVQLVCTASSAGLHGGICSSEEQRDRGEGGLETLGTHETRVCGCSHTGLDFKGAGELQRTARTPHPLLQMMRPDANFFPDLGARGTGKALRENEAKNLRRTQIH